MLSTVDTAAILLLAGVAAGLIGSAGGITSLVSFPALLAVGLPAHAANVANNVALVGCWPGSALASQPELHGRAPWLKRWTAVAAAGAAAGAVLLVSTPSDVFARVVPFLVAAGSLALLLEPRLRAWHHRSAGGARDVALPAGVVVLSMYNGYFGAGSGVMTLTLMLVLIDRRLPAANALKNMLIGAGSLGAATVLVLCGSVEWSAALPLAVGMLAGSRIGPVAARRLPANLLRPAIAVLGLSLAVDLWLYPSA